MNRKDWFLTKKAYQRMSYALSRADIVLVNRTKSPIHYVNLEDWAGELRRLLFEYKRDLAKLKKEIPKRAKNMEKETFLLLKGKPSKYNELTKSLCAAKTRMLVLERDIIPMIQVVLDAPDAKVTLDRVLELKKQYGKYWRQYS